MSSLLKGCNCMIDIEAGNIGMKKEDSANIILTSAD